eukprot:COSAG04_NODE_1265_length_7488_cov_2.080525_2_plen_209_part_00
MSFGRAGGRVARGARSRSGALASSQGEKTFCATGVQSPFAAQTDVAAKFLAQVLVRLLLVAALDRPLPIQPAGGGHPPLLIQPAGGTTGPVQFLRSNCGLALLRQLLHSTTPFHPQQRAPPCRTSSSTTPGSRGASSPCSCSCTTLTTPKKFRFCRKPALHPSAAGATLRVLTTSTGNLRTRPECSCSSVGRQQRAQAARRRCGQDPG